MTSFYEELKILITKKKMDKVIGATPEQLAQYIMENLTALERILSNEKDFSS